MITLVNKTINTISEKILILLNTLAPFITIFIVFIFIFLLASIIVEILYRLNKDTVDRLDGNSKDLLELSYKGFMDYRITKLFNKLFKRK